MSVRRLTRHFVLLRALRWLPVGLVLPFLVITPEARGLSLGAIGAALAVHSAVAIAFEVPSGALADTVGRRRVLLVGAALTALSLLVFSAAQGLPAFMASFGLLAAGRALISGSLEAWYVDSLRALDPSAPLSHGLSRGTAAEGLAMAAGSLVAGGLVVLAGPAHGDAGMLSGYGVAGITGAAAALAYLAAVAVLVDEPARGNRGEGPRESVARRTAAVLASARAEATGSVAVRVVIVTAVAWGMSFTAVELLWQPHVADLVGNADELGLILGLLTAASMLAVAVGAWASTAVNRRLGLWLGYLLALGLGALCIAVLGLPGSLVPFVLVYLLAYLGLGVAEPIHFELLNEAVGATARATLISAESLATQGGALTANLGVGALAAAQGVGTAWAVAGAFLAAALLAVALPLRRVAYASSASRRRIDSTQRSTSASVVDQFETEIRM